MQTPLSGHIYEPGGRCQYAALAGGDVFRRVEREAHRVPSEALDCLAHRIALIACAECMSRILHHAEIRLSRQPDNRCHVAGMACVVHGPHSPTAAAYGGPCDAAHQVEATCAPRTATRALRSNHLTMRCRRNGKNLIRHSCGPPSMRYVDLAVEQRRDSALRQQHT